MNRNAPTELRLQFHPNQYYISKLTIVGTSKGEIRKQWGLYDLIML